MSSNNQTIVSSYFIQSQNHLSVYFSHYFTILVAEGKGKGFLTCLQLVLPVAMIGTKNHDDYDLRNKK